MNTTNDLEGALSWAPEEVAIQKLLASEYQRKLGLTEDLADERVSQLMFSARAIMEQNAIGCLMRVGCSVRLALVAWINEALGRADPKRGAYDVRPGNAPPCVYLTRPKHMPAEADLCAFVGAGWLMQQLRERLKNG